jgi:hypothetical protein
MTQKPQTPSDPFHFQTSQSRELLACVEFAAQQADLAAADHGAWRWLSVSMVLAVQNACLCALDVGDPDGTRAMRRSDASIIARWSRAGRKAPPPLALREPRIVSPLELLDRVGDHRFLRPPFQLPLTRQIREDFDDLVDLRNTFLHFSQDGWTVDLREFPPLVLTACGVIRHLAVTQPAYLRTAERGHQARVEAALDVIEAAMEHYLDGAPLVEG